MWSYAFGGNASGTGSLGLATAVVVDAVGNVYAGGRFHGTGDFAAGPAEAVIASAGSADAYIVRIDSSLNESLAQPQTITFPELNAVVFGTADVNPGASASSSLPVTYTSSNESVATIVNGLIRIIGTGSTVITASQPGNTQWRAATPVERTLTVNPAVNLQAQTITFPELGNVEIGAADMNPGATASSNLPVSYASSNEAVATIVNGLIHINGVGTTVITATQAGDAQWSAATPVERTLTVAVVATVSDSSDSGGGCGTGSGIAALLASMALFLGFRFGRQR